MSRSVFSLSTGFILFAGSLASVGSAQAQSQTPGTIVKFYDDLSPTDSVITEDPVTHNIGIGISNPIVPLQLNRDGDYAQALFETFQGTNPGITSYLTLLRARGTASSPAAVLSGDFLGVMEFGGHDGSGFAARANIIGNATENWRPTGRGTKIRFLTTLNGTPDPVERMVINHDGNVGIGTVAPGTKLEVSGGAIPAVHGISSGDVGVWGVSDISAGVYGQTNNPFAVGVLARSAGFSDTNPGLAVVGTAQISGMLTVKAVQITGADFSEKFEVRETKGLRKPGMVVAIDPQNPGKLVLSTTAYNRRVAGILSGAGGINPGMLMGQPGTLADGDHPVALSGRVYVWADASKGPIVPGDLLTTSNVPGHAMKVTNYSKAQGATIGKAMTELRQGRGLVLTLVTLQ
jgi:hypothetical protein